MWRSMSITNKILWSLSILVCGYSLTIVYGFFMGIKNNAQLNVMSSKVFPSSQLSQQALNLFEEEIKIYQNMVSNGDSRLLEQAREKAAELIIALESLEKTTPDELLKKDITQTQKLNQIFNAEAPNLYEAMRKSSSEYDLAMMEKAAQLAAQSNNIHDNLKRYRDHFSSTISSELLALGKRLRHLGNMNVLIFVLGVGTSLMIILFIVIRFIRIPLQKTIDSFSAGAMGDFSTRLDESSGDEFGRLAHFFNTFMEKLEVYNRDLHDEIQSHQRSEEQLRKSEELYTKLVNTIPEVVIRTDLEGNILYVNDFTLEISGYNREELVGQTMLTFIAPDEHERAIHNMRMMLSKRQPLHEYRVLKKDADILYFEIGGDILHHENGLPFGRVYVCRDITQRKLNELEKEKLQTQLVQAQKMESVGRLAGGVAHDFNNMLSVIIGNTEMALMDMTPSSPLHQTMQDILGAGMRSADLTRQLLAFARKQTIDPKILDLNDVVASMLKMLQRLIGEDIKLVWMPAGDLWPVNADPSQLDQILANLVVNARDAISEAGKITIETANIIYNDAYCSGHLDCQPGEYVLLAVSDNGMGMDKETLANIFEPFFTTKGKDQGTGLGLATVYGIVRQNSGFINVYSEPGQGTTFKIYLPRCTNEDTQDDHKEDDIKIQCGSETILIVEDDASVLNLSKGMLEKLGYAVFAVNHTDDALSLVSDDEKKIDLLMTDVVMPDMNGKELAKRINDIRPNIKCLYMSGYTANVIAHHGILDKNIHFIAKPFNLRDLAAKLREVIEG